MDGRLGAGGEQLSAEDSRAEGASREMTLTFHCTHGEGGGRALQEVHWQEQKEHCSLFFLFFAKLCHEQ
jgi:hypothetical protein